MVVYSKPKMTVAKVARQVKALKSKLKKESRWLNFRNQVTAASLVVQTAYNMCHFSSYTPIFGTTTDDLSDSKAILHSSRVQCRVSLENSVNNEEETTRFSAYLISLKDEIPQSRFNSATGVLTLTQDQDFTLNQGIAYLNPKMFKVHKKKFFTLTNYGTNLNAPAGQSQFGTAKEWEWVIKPRCMIEHPAGNFIALSSALDPSKQYYVVVFSDNQTGDLESPALTINQLINMRTVG